MGRRVSAVTANLGCGGPHSPSRQRLALKWLTASGIDLLLLQEVPPGARSALDRAGYASIAYRGRNQFRCQSVVAFRRASKLEIEPLVVDGAEYHGSYVAAAAMRSVSTRDVVVMSVHASPSRPSKSDRERWNVPEPPSRPTGKGELWDSDFLLESVRRVASKHRSVLIAGDWNEARAWDDDHAGSWGAEFFAAVRVAGLVDCTRARWKRERDTYGDYQVDHVFASEAVDQMIGTMEVGPWPPPNGSDHRWISFDLELDRSRNR